MGHLKVLAKQTAIYGMSSMLIRLINFLVTPWFTNIFQPAEYGVYIELYAWIAVLQIILIYGMETGYFRFVSSAEDSKKVYATILTSIVFTSLLFAIVFIMFRNVVNANFGYASSEIFIWFALINAVDAIASIPLAKLRMENRALKYGLIRIMEVIITVALMVFFYVVCKGAAERGEDSFFANIYDTNFQIKYIFIANFIASMAKLLMMSNMVFVRLRFNISVWKSVLKYSLPLMIAGLPGVLNDLLDRIMLRYLLPEHVDKLEQLGIYGACLKIAVIIAIFNQVFRYGAEPFYFRLSKEHNAKLVFADVMKYYVIISLCFMLCIAVYIDAFQYLIGARYREGIGIVPILLMAYLMFGILYNLSIWYKLTDMTKYAIRITAVGIIINIALNIVFVPTYGYVAAAWAKLASFVVMVIYSFILGQKHYKIQYQSTRIISYIAGALSIVVFFYFVSFDALILDFAVRTIVLSIYFIIIFKLENGKALYRRALEIVKQKIQS